MNTINLGMSNLSPRFASRWGSLKHHMVEWRRRSRSRRELMYLGEAGLHDVGLSRCDAAREASKTFWMA
jgi:uncharacterized protein YjiS (DUF1127 family)